MMVHKLYISITFSPVYFVLDVPYNIPFILQIIDSNFSGRNECYIRNLSRKKFAVAINQKIPRQLTSGDDVTLE